MFIKLFIRVDLNFCSPNWNLWSTNDVQHRINLIEIEIVIQWCCVSVNSEKVKCDNADEDGEAPKEQGRISRAKVESFGKSVSFFIKFGRNVSLPPRFFCVHYLEEVILMNMRESGKVDEEISQKKIISTTISFDN